MAGVGTDWPLLLGANEVVARDGAEVVARLPENGGGHPLLVAGRYGNGKSWAKTSDIGPTGRGRSFSNGRAMSRCFRPACAG
ncbi:MAG: glutamine amidotransferase [Rhodobacteraceae bacterium]|nr:glutamine amidotransferase [Paracoccaceae bacterium]